MRRVRTRYILRMLLPAIVLVLAACGAGVTTGGSTTGGSSTSVATSAPCMAAACATAAAVGPHPTATP